jgi:enamine deaminase RidA (YjgF/YER057c/UK114 family)
VFFAGSEGYYDADGNRNTDLESQTVRALDQAKEWLADAGLTFTDVVRMNQYLSDRAMREQYMSIRDAWLADNAPDCLADRAYASILVIQDLVFEDMFIEIELTAYAGS